MWSTSGHILASLWGRSGVSLYVLHQVQRQNFLESSAKAQLSVHRPCHTPTETTLVDSVFQLPSTSLVEHPLCLKHRRGCSHLPLPFHPRVDCQHPETQVRIAGAASEMYVGVTVPQGSPCGFSLVRTSPGCHDKVP